MKCRTCGNEMEIRQTETGKVAICHQCKVKRKLVKKAEQPKAESTSSQTYSNIPNEDIRRKSEQDVKDNYSQMLSAGTEDTPRSNRPSRTSSGKSRPSGKQKKRRRNRKRQIAKLIIILVIIAVLGVAAFFGFKLLKNRLGGDSSAKQTKTESQDTPKDTATDSLKVSTDAFAVEYLKHEVSTDRDGNPCLLVYYTFTNKQSEIAASALNTVSLTAEQNSTPCQSALVDEESEEITNGVLDIESGQSATICQVFALSDQSDVTLKVSDLLDSDAEVLGEQTITLE